MASYTNHTSGPRGINLTDEAGGGTKWIEPGETIDLKDGHILGKVPDLGKPADTDLRGIAVANMTRAQLEQTMRAEVDFSSASDDQLREAIERQRQEKARAAEDAKAKAAANAPDLSILDGNVIEVKAKLDALDLDHLKALREAEVAGKNRAGALAAIDEEIAAKPAA